MQKREIAIVGLGYVGLPLLLDFARKGIQVLGVDVDANKITQLQQGKSYIQHLPFDEIKGFIQSQSIRVTSSFEEIGKCRAVVLCLPTFLSEHLEPDLSWLVQNVEQVGPFVKKGTLVVLESIVYPGTTEEVVAPILERCTGKKAGVDFHLAVCPEREDPGNPESRLAEMPRVVGGLTPTCRDRALELYRPVVKHLVPVSSLKVAEASKLLENIFRGVNIALVNELKVVLSAMGIDIWEVVEAAKSKPRGFISFQPGPGAGGRNVPMESFYMAWKAREHHLDARLIEVAGEINLSMPDYILQRTTDALNDRCLAVRRSRVLIIGLTIKPDVDDGRDSPSLHLMDLFKNKGAQVFYYDPHVPFIKGAKSHWEGTRSIDWKRSALQDFDAIVLVTAHRSIDYTLLAGLKAALIDTRNTLKSHLPKEDHPRIYPA